MKRPNGRRLPRAFFARPTLTVAKELIGKLLVRVIDGQIFMTRITEVEAYRGEDDLACHAARGRTPRTEILYTTPGTGYVYLIYGMYHCLNVVTEKKDFPAAILIRGCEPVSLPSVIPSSSFTGPGRLCRTLHITRALNGADLITSKELWFADDGEHVPPRHILRTPRIGVDYAGACALYPWRFLLKPATTNNEMTQKKKRAVH